jgi:type II secretory pathway predicted ATPase ExeA
MVTRKQTTPPAAATDLCTHFGLHRLPFTREVAVAERWHHPQYDDLADHLRALVEHRLSAALIAPPGLGKTVVLRALRDALPEARYRTHYVKVTDLSKRDFCREIATALGAKAAGYYGALVRSIQDRCLALVETESVRPVLILDDCHDARPEVLAILRVLANFEMDSRLVVSLVLAGQARLRTMLRRDDLEDVCRRLSLIGTLRVLSRDETPGYLDHRLRLAGGSADLFDRHAIEAVYEATQGNLRAIDTLALRALQLAADAGVEVVDARLITAARAQVSP